MKRIALFLFLIFSAITCIAQTQIDPTYQVAWNLLTGAGAPTITCTQNGNYTVYPYGAEWGQSYQDTTNNVEYKCTTSGWVKNLPTTGGTITGNLAVTGTVAAGATTPTIIGSAGVTFPDGTLQSTKALAISPLPPGLVAFGDSICNLTGPTDPEHAFITLLGAQLGGTLTNNCVSGSQIESEPQFMYVNGSPYPTAANNPLTLEQGGKNNATNFQLGSEATAQSALTALLTHRGSNNIVPVSACSTTGTWAADATITTALASTTNGSTLTCSITSFAGGAIGVPYRVNTTFTGTASVKIDGTVQGATISSASGAYPNVSVYENLYPVAAGVHSVVITVTSVTGANNIISIPDIVANPNPAEYFGAPQVGVMEVIPYQNQSVYQNSWVAVVNTAKLATVNTVAGYGFKAFWLPITNVPCTNGTSGCTGGFNAPNYIANQPGVVDPDGLSCSGSTSDTVHPNNCGHKAIYQALQTDLGIVPSSSGAASGYLSLSQNVVTVSHTFNQVTDCILYMAGSGLTLTLPIIPGNGGPCFFENDGTSPITIAGGSGSFINNIPTTVQPGQSVAFARYGGGNWFALGSFGINGNAFPNGFYVSGPALTAISPGTGSCDIYSTQLRCLSMGMTTGVAPGILFASYSSDFSVFNTMINLDSTGFVHLGAATGVGLDQLGNSVFTTIKPVAARRGTFICTAAGTITIANANYAAGSDVSLG